MTPIIPNFKPMLVDGRHQEQQSTALMQRGFAREGNLARFLMRASVF
jgi:hypothetical protein